jgi:transcriptional regulator with XRE-family HTH domain
MEKVNIGKNIKILRLDNKLSQKAFGELFGFSARTVSDWECCNTEPDLTTIKRIVKHFDITYDELFDD